MIATQSGQCRSGLINKFGHSSTPSTSSRILASFTASLAPSQKKNRLSSVYGRRCYLSR